MGAILAPMSFNSIRKQAVASSFDVRGHRDESGGDAELNDSKRLKSARRERAPGNYGD